MTSAGDRYKVRVFCVDFDFRYIYYFVYIGDNIRVVFYPISVMPFVQRVVAPVHLSRVKLHDEHGVPIIRDRELDAVTNCALSNALRQMASVAVLADEVFRELRDQLADVATRSAGLKCRVQALGHLVDHADPKAVTVRKSSLIYFSGVGLV